MSRIPMLEAYLAKKPGDRFTLYSLGMEYRQAGEIVRAEACFRDLLARHPLSGAGYLQLGQMLADVGRAEEAVTVWRSGLDQLSGATDAESRRSFREIQSAIEDLDISG